jgi:O-antigen ligase
LLNLALRWLTAYRWQALLFAWPIFLSLCLLLVIPSKKLWILYVILLFPLSLSCLPEFWELAKASRLYQLILLYLGFLWASMFWSPQLSGKTVLATSISTVILAHFVLLTAGLRVYFPPIFERQLNWLCLVAATCAISVSLSWYLKHPFPQSRLEGLGYLNNSIRSASLFGIFSVIAWYKLTTSRYFTQRIIYSLMILAILTYVCLTWTRSVLLAIMGSLTILTALNYKRETLLALGGIGGAGLTLILLFPELTTKLLRPEPYRPYIWLHALAESLKHPWFGKGYFSDPTGTAKLADGSPFYYLHSHNFFIENLRIGGVIGLGLAVWLATYALYQSFCGGKASKNFLTLALLSYSFIFIAPNGLELLPLVRVKEAWLIFWLPLGLAVSEELSLAKIPAKTHLIQPIRSAS